MLLLDTSFPGGEDGRFWTPCSCLKETSHSGQLPARAEGQGDLGRSEKWPWGAYISPHGTLRALREQDLCLFPWITQKTHSHSILISPVSRSGQYLQRSLPVASDGQQGYLRTSLLAIEDLGYRAGAQEWACSHGDFMPTMPAQDLSLPERVLSSEGRWL